MMGTAERIHNDDGGWFCSNCGYFRDDCYDSAPLRICPSCKENLIDSNLMTDRDYRLSIIGGNFCDDEKYPKWLLKLRTPKGGKEK